MSSSQHPVALRLERQVGGATKLLATVMGLPLVDGIFPALVLAGAVSSVAGILQVGLLVFGGSATVAVILAEMDGSPREQALSVAIVGVGIIGLAAIEAAFAPTIASVLDLVIFERFAALVMAAIAAKTASSTIGEYLPRPAVIVGLGMIASFQPSGFKFATLNTEQILYAAGAAGVGVGFAMAVALASPWLRGVVDVDRFRFGSAVALGLLPLSILGHPLGQAPLVVLAVTSLLAYDPNSENEVGAAEVSKVEANEDGEALPDAQPPVEPSPTPDGTSARRSSKANKQAMVTDGAGESQPDPEQAGYGYPGEESDAAREPWL